MSLEAAAVPAEAVHQRGLGQPAAAAGAGRGVAVLVLRDPQLPVAGGGRGAALVTRGRHVIVGVCSTRGVS